MPHNTILLIKRIIFALVAVSVVITGICFAVECVKIYRSGDSPYSRSAVEAAFGRISVPVYVCTALTVLGFAAEFFIPDGRKAAPKKRKPLPPVDTSAEKERALRRLRTTVLLVLLVIASTVFLVYALNPTHYHQSEITDSVINAMYILAPCTLIPMGYAVFVLYHNEKSLAREYALTHEKPCGNSSFWCKKRTMLALRILLLAVGVGLAVYGYIANGTADVLTKATNICTECIGLG